MNTPHQSQDDSGDLTKLISECERRLEAISRELDAQSAQNEAWLDEMTDTVDAAGTVIDQGIEALEEVEAAARVELDDLIRRQTRHLREVLRFEAEVAESADPVRIRQAHELVTAARYELELTQEFRRVLGEAAPTSHAE